MDAKKEDHEWLEKSPGPGIVVKYVKKVGHGGFGVVYEVRTSPHYR
jgi:hypothetical protein